MMNHREMMVPHIVVKHCRMYSGNLFNNLRMGIKIVGYVRVGESLYTQVIIWINIVLNHIDTRTILTKHEGFLNGI